MPTRFSQVQSTNRHGNGNFSVRRVDLPGLGIYGSPVAVLDHFHLRGNPFPPHPHAGFSTVSYVLEDSTGGLRSRDSLGNDLIAEPGSIVWTEAGRGMIHEESPADLDRELHGFQIFINLSSRKKFVPPRVLQLAAADVPEWRGHEGDRVRVLVGSFGDITSPLTPAEPFTLLDAHLHHEMHFSPANGSSVLIYVLEGEVSVVAGEGTRQLSKEEAVALHSNGEPIKIIATKPAHLLVLSGMEIREPVVMEGPFIMNEHPQIEAAYARYHAGDMGRLEPLVIR